MFKLLKKEEPISQEIIDYYNKHKGAINSDTFGDGEEDNYLTGKESSKESRKAIVHNIELKLKKISNLKTRYPYLAHYVSEEYCPTGSMDHALTFCLDKDGEVIETREIAIRLASMGVSKFLPHTYHSDLEMLLIVIVNKGFYGADWCFEPLASSLDFIPQKFWDGEYCSRKPEDMLEIDQLIAKIYEIVLFENPIREVYDQIRELLNDSNKEEFSKHRQQVEEILSNELKAKVFMRYFSNDRQDINTLNTLMKI